MTAARLRRVAVATTAATGLLIVAGVAQHLLFAQARGTVDGLALVPLTIALTAVGGLVTVRQPDNSYGWVVLVVACLWTLNSLLMDYAALALARDWRGAAPASAAGVVTAITAWGTFVTFGLLLYPTGTLPSRRWRWVGRAAGAGLAFMTVGLTWTALKAGAAETVTIFASGESVRESGAAEILNSIGHVLVFGSLLAGVVSLFVRHRRAGAIERLQLKWFGFGAALVALSILVLPIVGDFAWLEVASITAMPIVIGIAILRWHLYDIDRIVSRGLAYALLSILLVGTYLAAVTVLTALTAPVTRESPIAVAAATLLAAALFQPARRRIQSLVDRRFNRARYDARRTVEAFASTLRQDVDLDDVNHRLAQTVDEVLKPAAMTIWLRPGAAG